MAEPLISLSQAPPVTGCAILAVERRQPDRRHTGLHRHGPGQLLGSMSGLLTVVSDTGRWVIPATHAIWIPPHRLHGARSHGPFNGWSLYVAEDASRQLPSSFRTVRMSGLLREAVHRAACWEDGPRSSSQQRLASVILDEIADLDEEPLGLPMPSDLRLRRIATAILDDLADDRGLEAWAAWAGISPRSLSRRFVAETGFSFTSWRQRARLLRSLELLAGGAAVTSIALDLGYSNVSAFIALFRRTFGTTPLQYRQCELVR